MHGDKEVRRVACQVNHATTTHVTKLANDKR